MNESYTWTSHTCEWVIDMNKTNRVVCDTREWVICHIHEWVIYMNERNKRMSHTKEWYKWMSHTHERITHVHESYTWTSRIKSYVTHTDESYVTHMNESYMYHPRREKKKTIGCLCLPVCLFCSCVRLVHVCDNSSICVTWLWISHSCVWLLKYMCDMTMNKSFMCVTTPICGGFG